MILWTIRHTKPYNPNDVCYGRLDFDVSPTFEEESDGALKALLGAGAKPTRMFTSPLKRCLRLAEKGIDPERRRVSHEILTPEAMDPKSAKVAELYKAMTANSITSYNWSPMASVYMMHSIDDETVPYTNASNAQSKWQNANITFNFGHYGGHVNTCLRFINAVKTQLETEEKERELYE